MGEQRGRIKPGLNLFPRKRRTPLKRYKVLATLPEGERIYLVIKARSKKNASFFAMQDYHIVRVEIIAVLGRAREEDELF